MVHFPQKRLQVFVSSTFTDLREERQAAVEAILESGHIPAGMELFTAGDESQMEVIKQWIDQSDVYLLILGGRYGSIEPKTDQSYIHLEYNYALERQKPVFACVLKDPKKRAENKSNFDLIETRNSTKYDEFRSIIQSRVVEFWEDTKDIKYTITKKLQEFARRDDLIGWVKGDQQIVSASVTEEIARLSKENAELRQKPSEIPTVTYLGLSYEELRNLLLGTKISLNDIHIFQGIQSRSLSIDLARRTDVIDLIDWGCEINHNILILLFSMYKIIHKIFNQQDYNDFLQDLDGVSRLCYLGLSKFDRGGYTLTQDSISFINKITLYKNIEIKLRDDCKDIDIFSL